MVQRTGAAAAIQAADQYLDVICWRTQVHTGSVATTEPADTLSVVTVWTPHTFLTDITLSQSDATSDVDAEAHIVVDWDRVCVADPLWEGYLVTGDLSELATLIADGETLSGPALFEPAVVRSLRSHYARSLNIGNTDRTRAYPDAACECYLPSWNPPVQAKVQVADSGRCISGAVRFVEGYNAQIGQDVADNAIIIGAYVGSGVGEPCAEVPLLDNESPPTGFTTYDASLQCNEVLRSVNGVGGRVLSVRAGRGAAMSIYPNSNTLVIDVNMNAVAACDTSDPVVVTDPDPNNTLVQPCEC